MDARTALAQNAQLRSVLLASAPRMRKNLGNYTATGMGSTTRVQLFNVGIVTGLQVVITCPITIGTAIQTPSARAPYNLISRVRLTDYDGTDRVNWSGWQLWLLNCVRSRLPYGWNCGGPIYDASGSNAKSGIVTNPTVPTAIGNGTVQFVLDIPLAYDPEADLRGAILAQTAVGSMYLTIDWASSLLTATNLDAVYTTASGTVALNGVTGPTIQVYQEYLMPQSVGGGLPIPGIDLQTVYELAGNVRDNSNLAVGSEKLINYPNVRSVIGSYITYMNGTSMGAADITQFRLIANGNNVLRDDTLFTQQMRQRNFCEGDIGNGSYFFLHRAKPVETALFGNVQLGVTPSTVNANAALELGFESFYTKGSALPGLTQN